MSKKELIINNKEIMEFRIQDILKNIIPGFMLAFVSILIYGNKLGWEFIDNIISSDIKEYSEVVLVILLILSYITGYFVDLCASGAEMLIYRILDKPSHILLNKPNCVYTLVKIAEIKQKLAIPEGTITPAKAELYFKEANLIKDNNPSETIKEKVKEYYNSYIFSRNMLLSLLFTFIIYMIISAYSSFSNCYIIATFLLVIVLFFFRWRSRAFYYSRQVFNSILFENRPLNP
jgi:hypothetical protein